jgi:hypothetical protein
MLCAVALATRLARRASGDDIKPMSYFSKDLSKARDMSHPVMRIGDKSMVQISSGSGLALK